MGIVKEGAALFFVNEQHQQNYEQLQHRFKGSWSSEYAAGAYVSALPEVFYRIDWSKQDSPLSWYFGEWDEEDESHKESGIVSGLSSVYIILVRAAVELFTGRLHKFDLQHFLGSADNTLYRVFLQLIEIRRRSSILNLADHRPDPEEEGNF